MARKKVALETLLKHAKTLGLEELHPRYKQAVQDTVDWGVFFTCSGNQMFYDHAMLQRAIGKAVLKADPSQLTPEFKQAATELSDHAYDAITYLYDRVAKECALKNESMSR